MRTTWEKVVHHVRTIHGNEISNELLTKKTVIITKPYHTQNELEEHKFATKIRYQSYQLLDKSRQFQKGVFEYQLMQVEPTISAKDKCLWLS